MKFTPFRIFLIINYGFVFSFFLYCFPYSIDESQMVRTDGTLDYYEMCGAKWGCLPGLRFNTRRISCKGALLMGDYVCPLMKGTHQGSVVWYSQTTLFSGEVIQALKIDIGNRRILDVTLAQIQGQMFEDILMLLGIFSALPILIYALSSRGKP